MATTTTITRKQMFQFIAEQLQNDPEVVKFCEKEIEKLSKPRVNRKSMESRVHVYDFLTAQTEPKTKAEIASALDVSIQKAGAAVEALVKEGTVIRIEGEGKTGKAKFVAASMN